MDSPWCQRRYARVLRATGLRPDLQLLPGKQHKQCFWDISDQGNNHDANANVSL